MGASFGAASLITVVASSTVRIAKGRKFDLIMFIPTHDFVSRHRWRRPASGLPEENCCHEEPDQKDNAQDTSNCGSGHIYRLLLLSLLCNLEDEFDFYRHAKRKTGNADDDASGNFLGTKYIPEEVRYSVGNSGMVEEVSGGCDEDAESDDASDFVEGAKVRFDC